jgi:fatty-acyl-CoA synthase
VHRDDVYMPITPMFHVHAWGMPYLATMLGMKQVYPGRYSPDMLLKLIASEGVTSPTACRPSCTCCSPTRPAQTSTFGLQDDHRRAAFPRASPPRRWRGDGRLPGYGMSETCPILTIAHVPARCRTPTPKRPSASAPATRSRWWTCAPSTATCST